METLTEIAIDERGRIVRKRELRLTADGKLTDVLTKALREQYAKPPENGKRVDRKA